ncbi:transporter [Alkalihalobacillus alcalophilus ATCC 27647 = CGMCC 1.3604]|uniref:Transporter n=1 Tax=Alkalihalobacillus alcalophilus ATCC 27647 = CGMCC 1.3604 TaxID=1218173 RepID=J8TQG9_ALKAL|nr:cation diffusion facilitator family transporter [Alkalihalobacillus alcalophilus]AFV25818.1 cation efflux transporter [Alkalihalobacillus alcalophilus ATCC 27647 = CGMCC 1.3604]KGA97995.1 transporter [Alkalihalobacillus alcalophilus ATCC 27647 = CGMCC 1.3604]MED1561885.1 cation diffusion facilitator family transporter [Alkalihalobacillus alcalophilus]THG90442.1 transporter [Alkalihalobacillus alcalophilus ATCC 27647 = CGMCC 1.3604]
MEEERYKDLKKGERGAIISIIAYLILAILKLGVGLYAGSAALKADGLNNATDIVVSIAVLVGLRMSQKPPDHDHPYGHWKAETVASLVASFIIMVVGIQVLIGAIPALFAPNQEAPDLIAAWVGGFSFVVMLFVYRYNRNLGKKIKSQAVTAASKDNLSDALVSIGATIGIIGAQFGFIWLDPLIAVLVGFVICKTAWDIFKDATHYLTDGFEKSELDECRRTALMVDDVEAVKEVKARYYGNSSVVDIVIEVNGNLDVRDAHEISDKVEEIIKEKHRAIDVNVHVEPDK